jgi:hypothetical protein
LHASRYTLLFGSALVYSPYHACLADTVHFFMHRGACTDAVIIQIADRAGFDEFLARLVALGIAHRVEPVCEDVYNAAQRIGCVATPLAAAAAAAAAGPVGASGVDDEAEICVEKRFVFPADLVASALARLLPPETVPPPAARPVTGGGAGHGMPPVATNLVKTDRSAFVVVRAWRSGSTRLADGDGLEETWHPPGGP